MNSERARRRRRRRQEGWNEYDHHDSSSGEENNYGERKGAIWPVSVMLRNCLPQPCHVKNENEDVVHSKMEQQRQRPLHPEKGISSQNSAAPNVNYDAAAAAAAAAAANDDDENTNSLQGHEIEKQYEDLEPSDSDNDENDISTNNYQIFNKTNQWRAQALLNIFLPIEMEIVVSSNILMQLRSHQKEEKVRRRLSHLFGLHHDHDSTSDSGDVDDEDAYHNGNHFKSDHNVDKNEMIVLCAKLQDKRSSHPHWDHVNERLDDLYNLMPQDEDLWNDLYKHMNVQFRAIVPSSAQIDLQTDFINPDHESSDKSCDGGDPTSSSETSQTHDEQSSTYQPKTNSLPNDNDVELKRSKSILLATSPLHPKKLNSISIASMKNKNENSNIISSILGSSKFKESIPNSLPPNSILIHYSDGTTRVCPHLYELLLKRGVLEIESNKNNNLSDEVEVDKFAKRFEDDMFDVLDSSNNNGSRKAHFQAKLQFQEKAHSITKSAEGASHSNGNRSTSNPTAKFQKEKSQPDNQMKSFVSQRSSSAKSQVSAQSSLSRGAFADAFDSVTKKTNSTFFSTNEIDNQESNMVQSNDEMCNSKNEPRSSDEEDKLHYDKKKESELLNDMQTDYIEALNQEIQQLEDLSSKEQMMLEYDLKSLETSVNDLSLIKNSVRELDNEKDEIDQEVEKSLESFQLEHFLLDSRRKKLLRELFRIYPIQQLPDSVYTIRGINLPHDMHSLTASDELISAGLGFVCHVVSMCSKYLSIPLRYRLICNSSRSAVRDDDFDVFPLFKERVVEREQFDRALNLLHRNIDLLLQMSGIATSKPNKRPNGILAKVYLLFQSTIGINIDDDRSEKICSSI